MPTLSSSRRVLPTLRHLEAAIERLPDPELWPEDSCTVSLKRQNMELTFVRTKLTGRDKTRTYRWSYEGKILINQH